MPESRTRLRIRVSPGARRTEIVGRQGEAWKVRVAAVAERGQANEAALRVLAERLGVARSEVSILSGRVGRDKIVELQGIDSAEAARRLERS